MAVSDTKVEREVLAKLFKGDATTRQLQRRLPHLGRGAVEDACERLMRRGLVASLGQASSATRRRPSSWWTISDRPEAFKLVMSLDPIDLSFLELPAISPPGPRSRLSPLASRRALAV